MDSVLRELEGTLSQEPTSTLGLIVTSSGSVLSYSIVWQQLENIVFSQAHSSRFSKNVETDMKISKFPMLALHLEDGLVKQMR